MRRKRIRRGVPRWLLLISIIIALGLALGLLFSQEILSIPGLKKLVASDDENEAALNELNRDFTDDMPYNDMLDIEAEDDENPEADNAINNEKLDSENLGEKENDITVDTEQDQADVETGIEYDIIKDGDYFLALVTKDTKLKSDYEPSDLKPIPSYMNPSYDMKLREIALEVLKAMWHEAYDDGVMLSIRSAYRSYNTQEGLFEDYANRHGIVEANRFSARPGQSEHQLGTTVDFGGTVHDWTAEFAKTDQGRWLVDNAHRFGFVMSYPESKEDITGYVFEPWHYRFIGVDEAKKWKESGKTLREYLETKPQEFE